MSINQSVTVFPREEYFDFIEDVFEYYTDRNNNKKG